MKLRNLIILPSLLLFSGTIFSSLDDYLYFESWSFKETWVRLNLYEDRLLVRHAVAGTSRTESNTVWCATEIDPIAFRSLMTELKKLGILRWERSYLEPAFDGYSWEIQFQLDGRYYFGSGSNAMPAEWGRVEEKINSFISTTDCAEFSGVYLAGL